MERPTRISLGKALRFAGITTTLISGSLVVLGEVLGGQEVKPEMNSETVRLNVVSQKITCPPGIRTITQVTDINGELVETQRFFVAQNSTTLPRTCKK